MPKFIYKGMMIPWLSTLFAKLGTLQMYRHTRLFTVSRKHDIPGTGFGIVGSSRARGASTTPIVDITLNT